MHIEQDQASPAGIERPSVSKRNIIDNHVAGQCPTCISDRSVHKGETLYEWGYTNDINHVSRIVQPFACSWCGAKWNEITRSVLVPMHAEMQDSKLTLAEYQRSIPLDWSQS